MLEVKITGPGELSIALVDRKGQTLLSKRLVVSGSDCLEARTRLPLELETKRGRAPVVPVLTFKRDSEQQVTFDGQEPEAFARERCRQLKVSPKLIERSIEAERQRDELEGLSAVLGQRGRTADQ